MRVGKKKVDVRIFWQILMPYLIVLLIAFISSVLYYAVSQRVLLEKEKQNTMAVMSNSINAIDQRLEAAFVQMTKLLVNPEIGSFLNAQSPLKPANQLRLLDLKETVSNFFYSSDKFLTEAFVYFSNSQVLITTTAATSMPEVWYNYGVSFEGLSYSAWLQRIYANDGGFIGFAPSSNKSAISALMGETIGYVHLIPVTTQKHGETPAYKGFVVLHFDVSTLTGYFTDISLVQKGWLIITDENGAILASSGDSGADNESLVRELRNSPGAQERFAKQGVTILHEQSSYNNWHYIAGIDTNELLRETMQARVFFTTVICVALLISLSLSLVMAYRFSTPMTSIVRKLTDAGAEVPLRQAPGKIYRFVEGGLDELIVSNREAGEALRLRRELIARAFLQKLFTRSFLGRAEFDQMRADIGQRLDAPAYAVVAFRLESFSQGTQPPPSSSMVVLQSVAQTVIAGAIENSGLCAPTGDNRVAALLFLPAQDRAYVLAAARQIMDELRKIENLRVFAGAGGVCTQLWDAQNSAWEAFFALNLIPANQREHVTFYGDLERHSLDYYFSRQKEQQLIGMVKTGNEKDALAMLEDIFDENAQLALTHAEVQQFYFDLRGMLLRLRSQIQPPDAQGFTEGLAQFERSADELTGLRPAACALVSLLCAGVQQKKQSHNEDLKNQIIAYVDLNYVNVNLSLSMIASEFDMSEKYLSNFFRDQTGESLSAYIENKRMSVACELLAKGETVERVSLLVGYNSANTFYRAFKRIHGITPGAYCEHMPPKNKKIP